MKENNQFFRFLRKLNLPGAGTTTLKRKDGNARASQTLLPPVPLNKPDQTLGKILVIDDDLIIQRTVAHALAEKRYQVFIAGDISEALGIVRQEKPDLILLDLTFPFNPSDMGGPLKDGFFVVEWLRRGAGGKNIPIIIISGTDPAQHQAQISAAGIVAYFRKPLDHDELLVAVHGVLGKSRWS
jgi:CheY-like chemotaxis protein